MTGALWAVASGIGFGLFQSINRRAIVGMDVFLSTFIQLLISTVVLAAVSLLTEDVGAVARAPLWALATFGLVGLIHFFVGWTLLNLSQKLIGAARAGPLLATTPMFGALFAALALDEVPDVVTVIGMLVTVSGVYVLSRERPAAEAAPDAPGAPAPVRGGVHTAVAVRTPTAARLGMLAGLGTALCWSVSPVFIRRGLEGLPSPLLGVTVSMIASVIAYGVVVVVRWPRLGVATTPRSSFGFKVAAALLVGLATWSRWIALDHTTVAIVLAVNSVSVPTVLLLAPLIVGRHLEHATVRVWLGAGLVVTGSLVLILKG